MLTILGFLLTACSTPRDQGFPVDKFTHGKVVMGESAYVSIAENVTIMDEDGHILSASNVRSGQVIYFSKTDQSKIGAFAIIQDDGSVTSFEIVKRDGPEKCPDWIYDVSKQCEIQKFIFEGDRK